MSMLKEAFTLLKQPKGEKSASLQLRLFAFFALLILVVVLGFMLILLLSGVFSVGRRESRVWVENELTHISDGIYADYAKLSRKGEALAEQLDTEIDLWLATHDMKAADIGKRPELIEELLSYESSALLFALTNCSCTGSFIILDATVNPALENAENSRAGIFLKRTEPNAIDLVSSKVHYLRGPASVARMNGIELLGQWQMEFDISRADFFHDVMDTARANPELPLSRLYYWSERQLLKDNSESGMLLCLPLTSGDGTVYGVCGLEVSSMLFKLSYSPDNSRYPRIFSTLSPVRAGALDTDSGLIAGNSYLTNPAAGSFSFSADEDSGLVSFNSNSGAYIGRISPVKLYPSDSPYSGDVWAAALMMPGSDWSSAISGNNALIGMGVAVLLILSFVIALVISRKYLRPVVGALDMVRTGGADMQRTNIPEIDDLIEYLARRDAQRERASQGSPAEDTAAIAPDLSAYEEFVKNIATLSAAERTVFNLYMKGYTAQEISELLYLSINTIKTHNKRIYTKLNVTSRKELMVYVQMMNSENTDKGGQ